MIKVEFPGPIGKEPCELAVSNLKELKEALSADESVRPWLATCAVLVNDEIATALETPAGVRRLKCKDLNFMKARWM